MAQAELGSAFRIRQIVERMVRKVVMVSRMDAHASRNCSRSLGLALAYIIYDLPSQNCW